MALITADRSTDTASSIAERMLALAAVTHQLAVVGAARGDGRLALQAVQAEYRQLDRLIHRLGIEDADVLDELEQHRALWLAALNAASDNPTRLRDLARQLDRQARRTGNDAVLTAVEEVRAWALARADELDHNESTALATVPA